MIKNTTEDDGGAYLCEGVNRLGSVIAVTWLNVKDVGKPRIKHENVSKYETRSVVDLSFCFIYLFICFLLIL